MISHVLMVGLQDQRLSPTARLALAYLHNELAWAPAGQFRVVKIARLSNGIRCHRAMAFRALSQLESLSYIESDPAFAKPKHYRLATPQAESLPTATRRAA
jgi:hypothetical protein